MTTIVPRQLAEAVSKLTSTIEGRNPNPVLGYIHMSADGDEMELVATNLDIRLNTRVPCKGSFGPLCVEASRLSAALGRIKDRGEAKFTPKAEALEITSGRSTFNLPTLLAEGFPMLQAPSENTDFSVDAAAFRAVLEAGLSSVSLEETRYYLCGVAMQSGDLLAGNTPNRLTFVSTDGHKGMARHIDVADLPQDLRPVIIPTKSIQVILKVFDKAEKLTIELGDSGHRMRLVAGEMEMVTKLIEGNFPDWRRVMPARPAMFAYDAKDLVASIETAAAVTGAGIAKTGKAVKLRFDDEETELTTVDTDNPAFTGRDLCRHQPLADSPLTEIGANYKYVVEMIKALNAETIEMSLSEGQGPIILTGAALDDRRAVIMPMRV